MPEIHFADVLESHVLPLAAIAWGLVALYALGVIWKRGIS